MWKWYENAGLVPTKSRRTSAGRDGAFHFATREHIFDPAHYPATDVERAQADLGVPGDVRLT